MKIDYYDWNELFQMSADILSRSIAAESKPISRASELYKALEKEYRKNYPDDDFPKAVTYRKKLHQILNIPYEQRIYKTNLYQLIGKYKNMAIQSLASYLTMPDESVLDKQCYLFYRVIRDSRTIIENRKLLYSIALGFKQTFGKRILFISYDDDTIVMICSNQEARNFISKKIKTYLRKDIDNDAQ